MMTEVMEQEDEYGGGTTDEYDPEEDTQKIDQPEEGEQGGGEEEGQEEGQEEGEEDGDIDQEKGRHKRKRHRSSQEDIDGNRKHGDSRRRGHRSHDPDYKKFKRSGSDRSEGEFERQHYHGVEHSDQEDGQRDGDRRRRRRSEDRDHKGKHRRHGRHRREKSRNKARLDDSRSSQDMEAEDGEILEDGEIDDDGEDGSEHGEENQRNGNRMDHPGSRRRHDRDGGKSGDSRRDEEYPDEDYEEGGGDPEGGHSRDRHDKRRPHSRGGRHGRERDRRDRRGRRDDKQQRNKGKRPPKYHDYDNVDDENQQGWMSHKKNSSGNHKHDYDSQNYGGDRRGDRFESPPGPYDSPSDEDEEFDGHRGDRSKKSKSMLSMLGDNMLDPNIAAEEGQEIYKKQPPKKKRNFDRDSRGGGHNNHDRGMNKRKNQSRDHNQDQPKKKPLLKTPMEERPICRFYKEGKCQKGYDCPFNHEKTPKKPELCKYYLNSYCSKEDNCIFMHSEFPCKFFHTGQECYGGDNCKFSHDPLTDETRHLIEKRYNNHDNDAEFEEDRQRNKNRPSLLGSPPRHLLVDPAVQERIKKIPSIFDIETHPPNQSPNKPGGPPNMMHPPHMQPPRPGFYNEMNMNRMQGPGPQMNQGPPGPRGPMGPMGPMNQGPMMGPRGPMNQGPPMGPPVSMPGPMMGPPRMMNQMNPALNPAVALVGALLQHAAGVRQPNVSTGGPMPNQPMGNFQGPGDHQEGMFPGHPDQFQGSDLQGPGSGENMEGQGQTFQGSNREDGDEEKREDKSKDTDPNKEKLAMLGIETDDYLTSNQKELFERINKTTEGKEESKENQALNSKPDVSTDSDSKEKEEDDNWYSSDEEDQKDSKKLTDVLKKINRQSSTPLSPQATNPPSSTPSTMNIMQMINAIKTSSSGATSPPAGSGSSMPRDPRKRQDPRSFGKSGDKSTPPIIPIESQDSPFEPPPPVFITSSEGDVMWNVIPVTVEGSPKIPPPGINLADPKYKNDPRIQKLLKVAEANRGQSVDNKTDGQKQVDPRTGQPVKSGASQGDPRLKAGGDPGKPWDPRLGRTNSDSGAPAVDPRLQRTPSNPPMGVHSLPLRPSIDPRMGRQMSNTDSLGSMGPRFSRQNSSSGVSRPADPRMGRQISEQPVEQRSPGLLPTPPIPPIPAAIANDPRQNSDPRKFGRQNSTPDPNSAMLPDLSLKPLGEPLINPKIDLLLDDESLQKMTMDRQLSQSSNDSEKGSGDSADKPKLDYRNDPRFKRKPAGKRKGSMEYASPLDREEAGQENVSSYNSYNRPPPSKPPKVDPRMNKSDPRTAVKQEQKVPQENVGSVLQVAEEEVGGLTPPGPDLAFASETEINTKDFFKTMDPTASPFC
ncbi:zinc finger CCCH domain-containing protein 4-like [Saccostrea cucullata]|uniref:zinc finger CCCH domain-containing protein 4-like n=1 Tax=Saccostrea cuccullata TaxID=36930 RepID=UPI002ED33790